MIAMSPDMAPTSANRPIRAGLYLRVSEDKSLRAGAAEWRTVGEEVAGQRAELEEMAARLGWEVAEVYDDNDTPATNPNILRKGFERMLEDLEQGVIDAILFYHSDRLSRTAYDAARVIRLFELRPELKGLSLSGGVDLSIPEGRAMFMIQATMGGMEVASTRRRVTRKNKRLAEKGVMHGAPRPFGWNEDRLTLHPQESKDLADAIRAVTRGKKVGTVRTEWFHKGYYRKITKKGRERYGDRPLPMDHSTVEQILINPRNCGYMMYIPQSERNKGKKLWLPDYVVYKDGKPVIGPWQPVVTPDEWWACVYAIKERKERRKKKLNKPHETSSKYLLTGIARCGNCMFPMFVSKYQRGTSSYERYGFRYACLSRHGGCGGVSRVGPLVDDLVVSAYLEEVRRVIEGKAQPVDAEIEIEVYKTRLGEIEKEIKEVNDRRRSKKISMSVALDMIEELEKEREGIQSKLAEFETSRVKRRTEHPTLLRNWDRLSLEEKKELLKRDIRAVVIHPQGRGRGTFRPELIEIEWAN